MGKLDSWRRSSGRGIESASCCNGCRYALPAWHFRKKTNQYGCEPRYDDLRCKRSPFEIICDYKVPLGIFFFMTVIAVILLVTVMVRGSIATILPVRTVAMIDIDLHRNARTQADEAEVDAKAMRHRQQKQGEDCKRAFNR